MANTYYSPVAPRNPGFPLVKPKPAPTPSACATDKKGKS